MRRLRAARLTKYRFLIKLILFLCTEPGQLTENISAGYYACVGLRPLEYKINICICSYISGLFNIALSTQTIKHLMVGWLMNNEWKRMWKEVAVDWFEALDGRLSRGTEKTGKTSVRIVVSTEIRGRSPSQMQVRDIRLKPTFLLQS
jgi:hypothetical protein